MLHSEPSCLLAYTRWAGACVPLLWDEFRCWDVLLKPTLDAVASKRQAKAPEPQVMLKWLDSPSGTVLITPTSAYTFLYA